MKRGGGGKLLVKQGSGRAEEEEVTVGAFPETLHGRRQNEGRGFP